MSWRYSTALYLLEMDRDTAMLFCKCQHTSGGGHVWADMLGTGSHHPESLYNAKSDCQTHARRLGLLHSQAESHKPWQPGYLLHHTRLLLPLNCSVMESTFCHHLHRCLLPMRDIIKIKSQGKGPAQLTINQ